MDDAVFLSSSTTYERACSDYNQPTPAVYFGLYKIDYCDAVSTIDYRLLIVCKRFETQ